jgi:hypothetical protein
VRPREQGTGEIEALYAELLATGERAAALRELLRRAQPDESLLVAVLRRAVPLKLLEGLASWPPWSDTPRILGAIALNPRTPSPMVQRLLPALFWRDLAEVARAPRLAAALRLRAEALLVERLPELRLGDRITLARLATPAVLRQLLLGGEARVTRAALFNPRLRESDLVEALQKDTAPLPLLREVADSRRWQDCYGVRLALALQARTPLGVALAQLTSLLPRDLLRVSETPGLTPLVQMSALRVARGAGRPPHP